MTEAGRSRPNVATQDLGGVRALRACCTLVVLLLNAAIVYGAAMVISNYTQITV